MSLYNSVSNMSSPADVAKVYLTSNDLVSSQKELSCFWEISIDRLDEGVEGRK